MKFLAAACFAAHGSIAAHSPRISACRALTVYRYHVQRHLDTVRTRTIASAAPYFATASHDRESGALPLHIVALRGLAALLVATCLQLGPAPAADAITLASAAEDQLLGIVRLMESAADSALTTARAAVTTLKIGTKDTEQADSGSAISARALIQEVYEVVAQNFDDARRAGFEVQAWGETKDRVLQRPLGDANAAHSAVREMLTRLKDPYSRYLTPEEFGALVKYDVSGVGLNLGTLEELKAKTGLAPSNRTVGQADADLQVPRETSLSTTPSDQSARKSNSGDVAAVQGEDGVWVIGVIRHSAADAAGVRQGDVLLSADGVPLAGQSPFQVASALREGSGSSTEQTDARLSESAPHDNLATSETTEATGGSVRLHVRHLNCLEEDISVVRPASSPVPSPVTYRLQRKDVGYVKLTSFNARAQKDVSEAVKSLQKAGASRFVLDLRGNRGGLVSEGVEVAKLFLDPGQVVVRPQGRARSSAPAVATDDPLTAAPLIVLVDGRTASAAEIVSGALRDNCRAVLVGGNTYGKGLIQSVYELGDGSGLILTVGKYLTPNGIDIDWKGIAPDFTSAPSPDAAGEAIDACRIRSAS